MSQTSEKRRAFILEQVASRGHVAVRELSEAMAVSEATVRRDLRQLAESERIDLVFGGATPSRNGADPLRSRAARNFDAKHIIGKLAAGLVHDYEMLYVDAGTTCFEMRYHLLQKKGLSIIVNSHRLAVELGVNPDLRIIALGGHYRHDRADTVGPLAANAIDQLRGYVAFIGADGIDMDFGISANEIQTAYLYQHVIKNARETILLIDHTKFVAPSLFKIADIDAVSKVVTDVEPAPVWREFLEGKGITLVVPGSEG